MSKRLSKKNPQIVSTVLKYRTDGDNGKMGKWKSVKAIRYRKKDIFRLYVVPTGYDTIERTVEVELNK